MLSAKELNQTSARQAIFLRGRLQGQGMKEATMVVSPVFGNAKSHEGCFVALK